MEGSVQVGGAQPAAAGPEQAGNLTQRFTDNCLLTVTRSGCLGL